MDKLSKDEILLLAMELDINSIKNFCLTCKRMKNIFENNYFWRNKLYKEYPFSTFLNLDQKQDFRRFYQVVENQIENINVLCREDNSNNVFLKPSFICPELVEFLSQADLGFVKGTKIPVNYIIYPALKQKVLNRTIISQLFVRYFKEKFFSENETNYFYVGGDMNRYLGKHLTEIEKNKNTFDRNKFKWTDFSLIISKVLIPESEITNFEQKNLKTVPLYNLSESVTNRDKRCL